MKIVINQQGIKREIVGAFALCISKADRHTLMKCLEKAGEDWTYGWIKIYEEPEVKCNSNTVPLPWEEASNENQPSDMIQPNRRKTK